MIADPIASRVQNVSGVGLEAPFNVSLDMVNFGPGSQTSRKGATGLPGVTVHCTVKHEQTKAGRRRSSYRMDCKAPAGILIVEGDRTTVPHSASAYLVVDRLESDSPSEKALVDMAVSALVNSLVTERTAAISFTPSANLTDFLNGEP